MKQCAAAPAVFVCTPIMDHKLGRLTPALQDARCDSPHLGIFLLLGHLRRAGRPCDLLDWVAHSDLTPDEVADSLACHPLVFFSCNSMNWGAVRILAKKIRERSPSTRLCIGGPHPTLYPDSVAQSGLFDAYFRGEADRFIQQIHDSLLEDADTGPIPGFTRCARDGGTTPAVHQEPNLRALDWHIDYQRVLAEKYLTLPVETSRGCRYDCAFCSIPAKNNWRAYPVETAIEQLEYAHSHLDVSRSGKISIVDDTFTTDHARILKLCSSLPESKFAKRLIYDTTLVDLRNRNLIEALEPFTSDLLVGAEVSTAEDAKKIKKAATPEMIIRAAENLHDFNMSGRAVFSFIIGLPWQQVDDCLHTVSFLTNLVLDYGIRVYLQWYWPMPGSAIWRQLEAEHRVHIGMADTPGFYRSAEWFYSVRKITPEDLLRIDARIRPVQLCLSLHRRSTDRRPLEYSPPDLEHDGQGWETGRNPFRCPA